MTLIREYLDKNGMSQVGLARLANISESLMTLILQGKRNVTPRVALKIEKATGGMIRKERLVWGDEP